MARALPGQNGPRPSAPVAVPWSAVVVLAIPITDVAPPAWTCRQADLQQPVYSLQTAKYSIVLRPAQPIPDQLQKLGCYGTFGGPVIGIGGEAQVLSGRGGAPGLNAVIPVVGHRAKVAPGHVFR